MDVDKDGDLDLLYQDGNTPGQGIALKRNDGSGNYTTFTADNTGKFTSGPLNGITFTQIVFGTVSNNYALFAVDYDKDGDTDIVQAVNNAAGSIFRNNGNGTFSTIGSPFAQLSIASRRVFIDVNNDGAIDQLYQDGTAPGTNIGVQINNGSGGFSTTTANGSGTFTSGPLNGVTLTGVVASGDPSVFAVDYDNDGDSDLLTAPNNGTGTLYRNNGGSFAQVTNPFPALSFASRRRFIDVDADGAVDMLYQSSNVTNTGIGLLLNNGSGTFTNIATNASGTFTSGPLNGIDFDNISQSTPGLFPADYDTDADIDLIEFTAGTGGTATGRVIRQEGNPPLLVSSTPADNATGIAPTTNITLVFDKNVVKSAGNFYVVRTSDNVTIETIPVGDARVTGSNTTWTINPTTTLALGTAYAIRIDEGVFRDANNRAYAGILDNTTLNFTTYNTATVTTAAAGSITGTSAVLGGQVTADGGAGVTERGVVFSSTNTTPAIGGSGVTQAANGSGTGTFSATISSLASGTTYYVRAYATNPAGTSYGSVQTFTTPTTVASIVRAGTDPSNAASVSFTVTFASSVTGLTTSNFATAPSAGITGSSVSSVSGSGTTYTVTVNTGSGSGTLGLNLANSTSLTPSVSNAPYTSGQQYTIDKTQPTVAISSSAGFSGSTTLTSPIPFTVTFSESVTGFVAGDLTVVNGTISGFAGSGSTYTFNVTPTTPGTVTTVNVPANVAQDAATNFNTAATQFSITYQQPTATVTAVTGQTPTPTATATVSYTVTFSTAVSGLTTNNFSVTSTTGATVTSVSGSGTAYTVVVNTGTGDGTLRLNVNNSTGVTPTITGLPYTSGTTYTITKSFAAAPTLRIQGAGSASGNSDVTAFVDVVQVLQGGSAVPNALQNSSFESSNVAPSSFLYQQQGVVAAPWSFGTQAGVSRSGSGFGSTAAAGDAVALLQSAVGSNGSVSQNLAVPTGSYQVSFQAIQRDYTSRDQVLNVFVNDVFVGSVQPTSASAYQTFTSATFSVTAPALTATVSTTASSPTSTAPIPFAVSFSQSVGTSFTATDVTVSGGAVTGGSFAGSGSGPYTFTITPSGTGTVSVSLAAGVATDANNTGNTASNTVSVQYNQPQTAAPVVLVPANGGYVSTATPTYAGNNSPVGATIRVYVDGVLLFNSTTVNSAGNWALTQPTALAQGSHTVYATAQLNGQTVSVNSNTNNFFVDSVRPTVATSSTATSPTSTSPIPVRVTFSENVTGFVTGDVTVGNGTITSGSFSGSGTTYNFTVTPTAPGTVTVSVPANVAQDQAGNGNTAATQFSIQYNLPVTATPVVLVPANNSTTANDQPTYSGTAPANATVTVYVDFTSRGSTTATAGGTWSFTQPSSLATGSHTVYVTAQLNGYAISANSNVNNFIVPNPATYTSSTADQPNTGRVAAGSTNQEILRVAVVIGGGNDSPLSAQSISFTTGGSTSAADIAAARVYYTGTSGTFATATAFGSAVANPNGSFTITGTQQLTTGANYFWLAYDVDANATSRNVLDATVPSLTISGTTYTPSVTSPTGNRQIIKTDRVAGQALRFVGGSTAGYVNFSADATNPAPVLNGQYTQIAWIKPNIGTGSTTYYVLGNGTGDSAAPYIAVTGNRRIEAGFGSSNGLQSKQTGPQTIATGAWSQVAAIYNGSTLSIYLNGELQTSLNTTSTPASTAVNYVGSAGTTGANYFPGDIDEVSQWNRALSLTELRQLRHLTLSGVETGLVSYLQFNESGTTTTDAISGTVGSLTGATRVSSTAPVGYGVSRLLSVTGTGNYVFTGTNAAINFSSTGATPYDVVVSRLDGQPLGTQVSDPSLQNVFTPAYWIVDRYSSTNFAATITYTLSPVDISVADQNAPANLKLYKRESNSDGAFDAPISATAANAAAGTVTFPVTSFSQTVIGSYGTSPLPVELVAFTAERVGKDGLLRWTTAQEKNNDRFEVESSVDGRTFRAIGRVAGHGTSTNRHDYQLTDANLARYARSVIYYRLRQVDQDGSEHLSDVVTLAVPQGAAVSATAYPNPTSDQLSVRVGGVQEGKVDCQLFDAQGRKVLQFGQRLTVDSQSDLTTSVRHLPMGVYMLRITLPDRVVNQSVIISR
ncbi:hypothetical protein B0919_13835 [Hymenobacter sp. CRA2]|nr:hypothetical protein B0919_13835 [Hymenobacter sp. CRA2]